jgi:5'-deoxynucleotidase YfbR-like HD superfamily hydrolase
MTQPVTAINTFSGGVLDFANPRPEAIKLTDIAHGLSMVPRFGAQALRFHSVAQHAVGVSQVVDMLERPELAIAALHHDSHEAYACDIPAPLKRLLQPAYDHITGRLDAAIAAALGFEPPGQDSPAASLIKAADAAVFVVEAEVLLRGKAPKPDVSSDALHAARGLPVDSWRVDEARAWFLHRADELGRRVAGDPSPP